MSFCDQFDPHDCVFMSIGFFGQMGLEILFAD